MGQQLVHVNTNVLAVTRRSIIRTRAPQAIIAARRIGETNIGNRRRVPITRRKTRHRTLKSYGSCWRADHDVAGPDITRRADSIIRGSGVQTHIAILAAAAPHGDVVSPDEVRHSFCDGVTRGAAEPHDLARLDYRVMAEFDVVAMRGGEDFRAYTINRFRAGVSEHQVVNKLDV